MTEWLYGRHAVEEALRAGRRRVVRVLVAEVHGPTGEAPEKPAEIEALAKRSSIPVDRVPAARLEALTHAGRHHQGVAAEVGAFPYASLADVIQSCKEVGDGALVLLVDTLEDPQNFGTLLRSAEAAGATAAILLEHRQVSVTPAVSNASAGAVEHLMIARVGNLANSIRALQDAGLWVYALQGEPKATVYTQADLTGPLGLVVGSEGRGVGRLVRERCDGTLAIPMLGKVESLNAAVAGSIVLFEVLRQRARRREGRASMHA